MTAVKATWHDELSDFHLVEFRLRIHGHDYMKIAVGQKNTSRQPVRETATSEHPLWKEEWVTTA